MSKKHKTSQERWQDFRECAQPLEHFKKGLLPIEIVTLAYAAFTLFLTFCLWGELQSPLLRVCERLAIALGVIVFYFVYKTKPSELTRFLRNMYCLALLLFWYPDIYHYCSVFGNFDHLFAEADKTVFGCQPALVFSQILPGRLWSELFYMGYFSYYVMIVAVPIMALWKTRRLFEKTLFIVLTSFFLYYLIYLFLPVAGPQYYFPLIEANDVAVGVYPQAEEFFATNFVVGDSGLPSGLFHSLVSMAQVGERPIAAFPSSHVGVATILLILIWRHHKKSAFFCFLPFYVLLCLATVYIKAHYLLDVFAGWITAIFFYLLAHWLYSQLHHHSHSSSRSGSSSQSSSSHHHHHHHSH